MFQVDLVYCRSHTPSISQWGCPVVT